ncbi:MAG: tRNA threonylcarbamoyladenosine dehydratase [Bacillota bacterium]|nr:tRNA threonylcarbamoyladenosine dehydratase [Bacillota bacterium]
MDPTQGHPFSRTELLIGERGLERLAESRVAVFGLGGVGSYAAEALGRAGVGNLVLVDHDLICPSNLNRQIHALWETVGQPKVEVMARRIRSINPRAEVIPCQLFYRPGDGLSFLSPRPDYLVDAIDHVPAKADLLACAYRLGIPVVSALGAGNKLDPTALRVADLAETHTCPLARAVRARLRRYGITKGIKVVFSTERPRRPVREEGEGLRRRVPGSISYLPALMGLLAAGVVITDLLGEVRGNEPV